MIAAARQTKSDITSVRGYKSNYLAATHFKSGMFSATTLQNRLNKNVLMPKTFPKRFKNPTIIYKKNQRGILKSDKISDKYQMKSLNLQVTTFCPSSLLYFVESSAETLHAAAFVYSCTTPRFYLLKGQDRRDHQLYSVNFLLTCYNVLP